MIAYLADRVGMDQFLDVGAGLPTVQNTHEAAQRWNPEARVVSIDNDPAVNAYGRALFVENDQTWFATADLRQPREVVESLQARTLDWSRPVVLMQCATMLHVPDEQHPWQIMADHIERLPSGSYVALTHPWNPGDGSPDAEFASALERQFLDSGMHSGWFRTLPEIEAFFTGAELVEPGLVPLERWWPSGPLGEPGVERLAFGGLARKP